MTNPTPHGQVPEALIDLIDAYAETRHRYGGIYNAKTEAARKAVIEDLREALGGVQALSAAPAGWKLVPEDATEEMVRATDKVNFANADADGTMHNVWNVMLAASPTPPAEQQAEESYVKLLAECRDAFPIPEPGGTLEVQWAAAMAHPDEVPSYVRLCVAAMQAAPKAAPGEQLGYKQALGSNNCMQCCVSYMLGLPLADVPHFADGGGWGQFASFVESKGYSTVMLPGEHEPEADYLASGRTERGTPHMVVMNGGKLVFDPHPSCSGLSSVQCVWLLAKRAAPQPAPAPLSDDTDRLREALQRIEGASMSMYATRSDMLEHCQDIARAALAAQGGKDAG